MQSLTTRRLLSSFAIAALFAAGAAGCNKSQTSGDDVNSDVQIEEAPQDVATDEAAEESSLDDILRNERRGDDGQRDTWRHPKETLTFFGIEPDMTVIEIGPGGGWYTKILAPYLADEGTLIVSLNSTEGPGAKYRKGWENLKATDEDLYGDIEDIVMDPPYFENVPEGAADAVLSIRQAHGWVGSGNIDAGFQAVYKALKPGGIFGVIDHRAKEGADPAESAKSGYVPEAYLIERAEAAGFVLDAKSDLNANPKDTTDHPNGVWSLPPNLRVDDELKDEYKAIGESDRSTLRFVKPAE